MRIAWLNADGTGKPEFISPERETGYCGRLSPSGQQVLYQGGPEPGKGERGRVRLYVMDLATKKRTAVDEPGETHGYCWSPNGLKVAYTWQVSLEKPAEVAERETLLITCDVNGRNRKTVTSRKYTVSEQGSGVVVFLGCRLAMSLGDRSATHRSKRMSRIGTAAPARRRERG